MVKDSQPSFELGNTRAVMFPTTIYVAHCMLEGRGTKPKPGQSLSLLTPELESNRERTHMPLPRLAKK